MFSILPYRLNGGFETNDLNFSANVCSSYACSKFFLIEETIIFRLFGSFFSNL